MTQDSPGMPVAALPAGDAIAAEWPALSQSKAARFAAIILLYFMQGVPLGLCLIAIPAWLAANGASPITVGAFVGTTLLPWSLKLFNGLLMDRFTFKPMGRRRSWILAAQGIMMAVFLALAVLAPGADDIAALTVFFFALNLCAVFNDVAVDGMTVDLVPEEERTTINGCMFASQAIGISLSAFLAGQLLASGQMGRMALIMAGFIAIASTVVAAFRERPGERLLPWSRGCASEECRNRQHDAWTPILGGVLRAVLVPTTLLFLIGTGLAQATFTFTDAIAPTLAVQHLDWGSDGFSSFASMINLAAALGAAFATPFLVRLLGLRGTMTGLFLGLSACGLAGGLSFAEWQDSSWFSALFGIQYVLALMLQVVVIVWAMRICPPAVAASLFALFMAVPNLARSLMSGWSGWIVEDYGYDSTYFLVAATTLVGLAFCLMGKVGRDHSAELPHEGRRP